MRAYDMTKYQRVIGSDGRVSGKWCVFGGVGAEPDRFIIVPIDVTIYDESRHGGRVYDSGDFTVTVQEGLVKLSGPRNESKIAEIDDARAEFEVTLLMVAEAYRRGIGSKVDASPVLPNSGETR